MNKLFNKLALLALLTTTVGIDSEAIGMEKNLAGIPESQKSHLQQSIIKLAVDQHEAYPLSVALIASAQHGDQANYHALLQKVNTALAKGDKDDAYKAWMLGRVLFAADSIHDRDTVRTSERELAQLLTAAQLEKRDPASPEFAMLTWACAYYAGVSRHNFEHIRQPMLSALSALEIAARQDPSSHELASNAVWAAVMIAHASAGVDNREVYDDTINRLKAIAGKDSVSGALEATLTRTADTSDYPAWAIGMLRVSAAAMRDTALDHELTQPLNDAIRQAKDWGGQPNQTQKNQWKASSEAVLGELSELLTRPVQTSS